MVIERGRVEDIKPSCSHCLGPHTYTAGKTRQRCDIYIYERKLYGKRLGNFSLVLSNWAPFLRQKRDMYAAYMYVCVCVYVSVHDIVLWGAGQNT